MPSLQQLNKAEKITIRCSLALKRAVRIRAAEQNTSVEDVCAALLSESLGLPVASESTKQAGEGKRHNQAPAA